ncbi:MAG: sigma-70 family RNA polymerase sigma factor [Bacteroidota bacterium]|nr:sigma-70 family RNA polymerase sigma factor [Bacteroidota bacterium]
MFSKYSDKRIIEELNSLDDCKINNSMRYLYKKHYPMALSIVKQYNADNSEVVELLQESLIRLYENIKNKTFRGDSHISTYLFSIMRNLWVNKYNKTRNIIQTENFESIKSNDDFLYSKSDELNRIILKLLDQIGKNCKEILVFYYFENCSMHEIKDKVGYITEQSVKSQKYRCLQQLIRYFDENPDIKKTLFKLL